MKNTLTSLALAGTLALGLTGCEDRKMAEKPEGYKYETYPVDKLFRDHSGWRVMYSDTNNELNEIIYYQDNRFKIDTNKLTSDVASKFVGLNQEFKNPRVYIDLPEGSRGEVRILRQEIYLMRNWTYAEIHIPKSKNGPINVNAGIEYWKVGKSQNHDQIKEIK